MKKYQIILICLISCIFLACESSDSTTEQEVPQNTTVETAPVTAHQEIEPVVISPEPVVEKKPEVKTPVGTTAVPVSEEDKEYARSVGELVGTTVSKDSFQEDKKGIMETISELDEIIKNKDYNGWLKYISPKSKEYWSNPKNLANVANRLPVKGIKIRSMKDYFLYVFIPARTNSKVEEIRYISTTLIKAVEPKEKEDIIYYIFEKSLSGDWQLRLDTL